MSVSLIDYFTDPVLRAPTIGSMLMCLSAGLMGVIVLLKRQSLIGEVLSHASYPGVIFALIVAGEYSIFPNELSFTFIILLGAFLASLLALALMHFLQEKIKVSSDAALCFTLASFFGFGVTLASEVQFSFTSLYKQALNYLYGQASTMTDIHIVIYGALSAILIAFIVLFYKELQISLFDKGYARSLGVNVSMVDLGITLFVALSIVIGIRSVGVVLMSAMLVAPVVAARQLTHHLPSLFFLSGIFSLISGFLGNFFSVEMSGMFSDKSSATRLIVPTGPMIVLVGVMIGIGALLFSPRRGLVVRMCRIFFFRYNVVHENLLKAMWKEAKGVPLDMKCIRRTIDISTPFFQFVLWRMTSNGWLVYKKGSYFLTEDGRLKASRIVRLHRLWELYLSSHMGVGLDRVHRSAEEMEHILTPEIERQLTEILGNPKEDPHLQPIPPRGRLYVS